MGGEGGWRQRDEEQMSEKKGSVVHVLGVVEGISYLLLLFVAMPMKYALGMPLAVRIVGSVHGALFVAFVVALVWAMVRRGWSYERAAMAFGASLIPFGTFIVDLKDEAR